MVTTVLFWLFAATAVVSALLTITRRNAVYSALFLVLCFFSLASLYLLLNAQFIAAVQVIVYAGAIMVLFLFVVMLLNGGKSPGEGGMSVQSFFGWVLGILLALQAATLLSAAAGAIKTARDAIPDKIIQDMGGNTEAISSFLFTKYVYPFEVVSVLLLVAIIGAVVILKKKP